MLHPRRAATVVFALIFGLLATPSAWASKRLAFVVGIDRYDNLSGEQQLKRAVADARAMTGTFKDLQFEVIGGENLGREDFFLSWQRFLDAISPGDTTAVFFAGHGIEMEGANYLMPRDVPAAAKGERVLRSSAVALTEILHDLDKRKPGTAFVVLDACRNNPFSVSGRSIGGARGLARVDERPGTLILYSAGIGQVALDHVPGEPAATNSVFTHTLVPLLKTPGLTLLDIAVQTQRRVDAIARRESHTQTPAFYSQLLTDVHLAGAAVAPAPTTSEREAVRKAIEAEMRAKAEAELAERVAEVTKRLHDDMRNADEERKKLASATPPSPPPTAVPPDPAPQPKAVSETPAPPAGPDPARSITPGSGKSFRDKLADGRDCPHCPEMVVVPAGSFMMGSPANEARRDVNEGPQRLVTIGEPYSVGKFEVTFAEWDVCVAGSGCNGHRPADQGWGRDRRPVISVNWDDAKAYVEWLSRVTGKRYRLLSEAEWEHAARAGTTTPFSTGRTITADQANFDGRRSYGGSRKGVWRQRTVAVGSHNANAWGLHDMHGNVFEWVEDCWNDSYSGAPTDSSAWTAGNCSAHATRGGSWVNDPYQLRSAYRFGMATGSRYYGSGFRVARSLGP